MRHLIELHLTDRARHHRLRQCIGLLSYPSVSQRTGYPEYLGQHAKGGFAQRVQNDGQRFLCGQFVSDSAITIGKVKAAVLALIPCLASDRAVLYGVLPATLFAYRHRPTPSKVTEGLIIA